MKYGRIFIVVPIFLLLLMVVSSCKKNKDTPAASAISYDPNYSDNYSSIADISQSGLWGPYNLHDPTIIKDNSTYYIYSTDVAYGNNLKCGIMWRKSTDLVHWHFLGWVFDGVPAKPLQFMVAHQPTYQQESIWAPYIIKVGDQYRLYYSVPGNNGVLLACIALATSTSPDGPWTDQGIVLSCVSTDNYNAIDPSVIIDRSTRQEWMTYGSYQEGIFIVELDTTTGMRLHPNDLGKKIAFRSNPGDAIEGSDILYNTETKKYYLFVSYDWLEDNYNVRVGRSDKPDGPYLDFYGKDMANVGDDYPMITARYQFRGHPGWQGFGGCTELHDGNNYYYVSQARLSSNKYIMDLHIHRMLWNDNGWPSISPERYVDVPQWKVTADSLEGLWEYIDLEYTTVNNQSQMINFNADGTISGIANSTWSFSNDELSLSLNGGLTQLKAKVFHEWDWENKRITICFSGLNQYGRSGWGKKDL